MLRTGVISVISLWGAILVGAVTIRSGMHRLEDLEYRIRSLEMHQKYDVSGQSEEGIPLNSKPAFTYICNGKPYYFMASEGYNLNIAAQGDSTGECRYFYLKIEEKKVK